MANALPLVLVIEDDDFILSLVCRVLQERFRVVPARSIEEGLQAVELAVPTLVLCDDSLPGFDLTTAMNLLHSVFSHASIVLMSESMEGGESKALDGGADAFLSKPFLRSDLLALVSSLVDGAENKPIAA